MWNEVKNLLPVLIRKHNATNCCAISWRYMLPSELNEMLMDPIIVLHDSLLPKYRGFAPTPTAVMAGETEFGVTALFAADKVDEGDIIKQEHVFIDKSKYIAEIIEILSRLYEKIVIDIFEDLKKGTLQAKPQDNSQATYSIWRNIEDCHIDWEQSAEDIYNFIRAIGTPYYGAYSYLEDKEIIIERAEIEEQDLIFSKRDCGKIWRIDNNCPIVICKSGLLKVTKAVFKENRQENVVFKKVRCRLK